MNENKEIVNIRVDEIIPNRFQPRLSFNEEELKELSESIKAHGIIQPLVVRRLGDKYEIIAGERRYKAACLAGLQAVPAIVVVMNDKESAEVALVENLQRKDLTAIEEAQSYKKILDMGYLTQEELASRMGVSQPNIANKLRLLNLAIPVKEALLANKISERHARSLLNISDANTQISMLNRIISERLTVRQTDDEINKLLGKTVATDGLKPIDVDINSLRESSQNVITERKPHDIDLLLKSESDLTSTPLEPKVEIPAAPSFENNFENPLGTPANTIEPKEEIIEEPKVETPSAPIITEDKLESFDNNINEVSEMPINPFADSFAFDFNSVNSTPKEEPINNVVPEEPIINEPKEETVNMNNTPDFLDFGFTPAKEEAVPAQNEAPTFNVPSFMETEIPANNVASTPVAEETPVEVISQPEPAPVQYKNIIRAISNCREEIRKIEEMGFKVDTEEFDFEDSYQFIIKITK